MLRLKQKKALLKWSQMVRYIETIKIMTKLSIYLSIYLSVELYGTGGLNIHGIPVTANNNSTKNNVFFFCFRFENSIL